MSDKPRILWADDEIDLLKPHILFLENKGYDMSTSTSGRDAVDKVKEEDYDLVILDENMPGISGLDALNSIKQEKPNLPVIMITKNEEEHIMEEAIGNKIADYLIKPVNPNQILLSIKKNLDEKKLVSEKTTQGYQREFMQIGMAVNDKLSFDEWKDVYKKLVYWEMELADTDVGGMKEVLETQKADANRSFCRFVSDNYMSMVKGQDDKLIMSHNLFRKAINPHLDGKDPVYVILVDNLRFDQWRAISETLDEKFRVDNEDVYLSILPTTTQYCRNAIFSGMMPLDIEKKYPDKWSNDEDEGGKNLFEKEFLEDQLKRLRRDIKISYTKVTNLEKGKNLVEQIPNMFQNKLNVIVYNFVDNFSHARTDIHVVRELAENETAYRNVMATWFKHSPLWEALQRIAEKPCKIIITTDHGSIRVKDPVKVVGDKNVNTNLRYKQGKSLTYNPKEVFEIKKPHEAFLPLLHVSSAFVFAKESDFFAYPNNYNYYVNYYKNTFQHGGISMEEMICPLVVLSRK
ncbi:MAG: PglZ domain-containing protein [Bacteroidetes bacterium]|nr:PglZ domain-containing protein [Bacteroidota bacterium]